MIPPPSRPGLRNPRIAARVAASVAYSRSTRMRWPSTRTPSAHGKHGAKTQSAASNDSAIRHARVRVAQGRLDLNGDRAPLGTAAHRIRQSRVGRMPTRAQEVGYSIPDLLAQIERDITAADPDRASVDGTGIPVDRDKIESERSRMSCR